MVRVDKNKRAPQGDDVQALGTKDWQVEPVYTEKHILKRKNNVHQYEDIRGEQEQFPPVTDGVHVPPFWQVPTEAQFAVVRSQFRPK